MHTYTHTYRKGGTGGVEMAVYALHRHALKRHPLLTLSLSLSLCLVHTHAMSDTRRMEAARVSESDDFPS